MKLIVNADDFGCSELINQGIIHGFTKGIISSSSILANGKAFDHAIRLAKEHGLPLGVHLNLTTYQPLTGNIPSITDKSLLSNSIFKKSLLGKVNKREIYKELRAQILKVKDGGIEITHFDGHRHIQVFPGIRQVIVHLAKEFGVKAIRLPKTKIINYGALIGRQLPKYLLIESLLNPTKRLYRKAGINYPQNFFGFFETGNLSVNKLKNILSSLGGGVNEFMCHPGYLDYSVNDFLTTTRPKELRSLTDKRILNLVRDRNIELINFKSLI